MMAHCDAPCAIRALLHMNASATLADMSNGH
jgi:hypothetical protein